MNVSLKRVLKKSDGVLTELVKTLAEPVQVWDLTEHLLFGEPGESLRNSYPIQVGSETIGRVAGGPRAIAVARLLCYLCDRELEVKTLANDALDKYREINLLYNLAEKLNASLDLSVVSRTVLSEAQRLIPATGAAIMLLDQSTGLFDSAGLFSAGEVPELPGLAHAGIAGMVVATARGEIVNQTALDIRYQPGLVPVASLICVPLKTEQSVLGVLTISHLEPIEYTAQHLKLLTTVAVQAAQALQNARLYQQQVLAAQEREALLQQRLQDLQLAVDETKRSRQVTEITETDYFQDLQKRVNRLRRRRSDAGSL